MLMHRMHEKILNKLEDFANLKKDIIFHCQLACFLGSIIFIISMVVNS
jgi:hypothetical protein